MKSKSVDCGPSALLTTSVPDKNPNDNPSGDDVMTIDDMISRSERIPAWWHTALTGEGQRFESAKELRLALLYYSMAKKSEYEFGKNEPKRIRVFCRFKEAKKLSMVVVCLSTEK